MESDLLSFVDRIDKSHQAVIRLCKALLLELIMLLASARTVCGLSQKKINYRARIKINYRARIKALNYPKLT